MMRVDANSLASGAPTLAPASGRLRFKVEGRLIRTGRLDADIYEPVDDPGPVLDAVRASGDRMDIFTFVQRLPESTPKFPYRSLMEELAVLPVSTFDHWWNKQIKSFPRNRARQAEKRGARVCEVPFDDNLVKGIWEIYNETPIRQGRPFRHFGMDLATVHKVEATHPDRSIFIGVFVGEQLIGFAKLVTDFGGTQANLMNILSLMKHKEKAPTNALIAQAVKSCAERGIRYLLYQKFTYANKGRDSLTHFKEINGFQPLNVPRYYVPMTPVGSLGLRLGLHQTFFERLPQPLADRLRRLRSAWHVRKQAGDTAEPSNGGGEQE